MGYCVEGHSNTCVCTHDFINNKYWMWYFLTTVSVCRYYGYRNPDKDDPRLALLKREWFVGKTCLDIGCNTGHVTLHIAKEFLPEKIVGIDIDGNLIGVARKNIKHLLLDKAKRQREERGSDGNQKFPVSMEKSFGPISKAPIPSAKSGATFPTNVLFRCVSCGWNSIYRTIVEKMILRWCVLCLQAAGQS